MTKAGYLRSIKILYYQLLLIGKIIINKIEENKDEKNIENKDLHDNLFNEIIKLEVIDSNIKINTKYFSNEFHAAIKGYGGKWINGYWILPKDRINELEFELLQHYGVNSSSLYMCDLDFSHDPLLRYAYKDKDFIICGRTIIHARGRDLKPIIGYGVRANKVKAGGSFKNYVAEAEILYVSNVPIELAKVEFENYIVNTRIYHE